ncbi:SPOSA6832_03789 [Sporobolomyces salmonicolor]|uniref:SPOSA6832_03789-mRNA-1:cds n=1 Tax=Sporidiobolus salmonicolor TaxID=5005 RepID=A0A0D6EQA2_SPOSA|nr:SPOSA6832_03789 [Sporobolomyces salmonicolor]
MPDSLNTVDLSLYLSGRSTPAQDRATAQAFVENAETVGFFYVRGWERVVPKALVESVFEYHEGEGLNSQAARGRAGWPSSSGAYEGSLSVWVLLANKRFFDLPQGIKDSLAYTSSKANRGYLAFGREETFEIGNDCDPQYPEHWPKEEDLPGFKETINRFHLLCDELHLRIMSLLALALNLPKNYFVPSISSRSACLRLLHYPPARRHGSNSRLGAHTDFGTVSTLSFIEWIRAACIDNVLTIGCWTRRSRCYGRTRRAVSRWRGPDGGWVAVEPKANTFVMKMCVHSATLEVDELGWMICPMCSSLPTPHLAPPLLATHPSYLQRRHPLPLVQPQAQIDRPPRRPASARNRRPVNWLDEDPTKRRLLLQPCLTSRTDNIEYDSPTQRPGSTAFQGSRYEPILAGEYYAKALEAEIGV